MEAKRKSYTSRCYFSLRTSGRQRFNVLGALHALTQEVVTVTNDAYINSSRYFSRHADELLPLQSATTTGLGSYPPLGTTNGPQLMV